MGNKGGAVCNGCAALTKKGAVTEYKKDTCEMCGVAALASGQACHYEDNTKGAHKFTVLDACAAGDAAQGKDCVCKGTKAHYFVKQGEKCDTKKAGGTTGGDTSSANALLSGLVIGFVLLFKF